ncbi:unnamed protein product [Trifolium pratense]|uniref:Uncharacterized protein n=1 Tax=Trifolium pratense TaxID=57577 RepID=A0ACB0K963_TRIPR|nr:unnamed protein product [Trifolium pratense]
MREVEDLDSHGPNLGSNNDKEEGKENAKCVDGVRSKEDNRLVDGGILLGQEDGASGTQHTSNTNLSITSGVVINETQSAEVDCLQLSLVSEGGGEGHKTGGVYSDGPRNVYMKLTKAGAIGNQDAQGKDMTRIHPTPAKVRKHQHTIQHLNLKIPNQDLSLSSFRANPAEDEASSCRSVSEFNGAFCDLFPDLYAKEAIKNVKVSERLRGNGLVLLWRWNWSESLSVKEARQLTELQGLFDGFSLHNNNHDQWRWIPDSNGLFTVKSCYTYLLDLRQVEFQDSHVLEAIQRLWKSDVPSKVNVFGWSLLLNRLPTRAALYHRGILTNLHELSCVLCFQQAEDEKHLFFSCPFSKGV